MSNADAAWNGGRPVEVQWIEDRGYTEPIDIRRQPDRPDPRDGRLGRHVARRAEDRAGGGEARVGVGGRELGQSEVGDERAAVGVDQDVRRLEVAMQDAPLVGIRDRPADRRQYLRGATGGHGAVRQEPGQGRPLDELHRQIRLAVVETDIKECDNVRMLEPGHDRRLVPEPVGARGRRRACRGQSFQCDDPAQPTLLGPVDDPHPAPAEDFEDRAIADDLARRLGRRRGDRPPRVNGRRADLRRAGQLLGDECPRRAQSSRSSPATSGCARAADSMSAVRPAWSSSVRRWSRWARRGSKLIEGDRSRQALESTSRAEGVWRGRILLYGETR